MCEIGDSLRRQLDPSEAAAWLSGRLSVDNKEWVCKTCYRYLSKRKCPPGAPCRQPDFRVLNSALQGLSGMENDLGAR